MNNKPDITLGAEIDKDNTLLQFTDIILIADDIRIPCHKTILINSGEYFEKLLNGDFNEKIKNEIILHDFSYYWLDKFIKYIYKNKISFNYNEFESILNYGMYLQLYNFNKLFDKILNNSSNEKSNHITELINIYGYDKLLELSKIHNLDKCYNYIFFNILKKDEDTLLSLSFNNFKEIISVKHSFDYSKKIEEKCNNKILDITVMNGKCFGNIPGIYEIWQDTNHNCVNINYTLNNRTKICKIIDPRKFYVYTIVRNDITTVTVNNNEYNNKYKDIYKNIYYNIKFCETMMLYAQHFKIFSPKENVTVIAVCETFIWNSVILCHIYNDQSHEIIYDIHPFISYNILPNSCITFSNSNIYFVSFRNTPLYTLSNQKEIIYTIVDIYNIKNKKTLYITDNPIVQKYDYMIADACYMNNLLYVSLCQGNCIWHPNNTIFTIDLNTNSIIQSITFSLSLHSLFTFRNILYGTFYNKNQKIFELCEIKNGELIKLRKSHGMDNQHILDVFVITGSYVS